MSARRGDAASECVAIGEARAVELRRAVAMSGVHARCGRGESSHDASTLRVMVQLARSANGAVLRSLALGCTRSSSMRHCHLIRCGHRARAVAHVLLPSPWLCELRCAALRSSALSRAVFPPVATVAHGTASRIGERRPRREERPAERAERGQRSDQRPQQRTDAETRKRSDRTKPGAHSSGRSNEPTAAAG